MRLRAISVSCLVLVLLLGACGGDDDYGVQIYLSLEGEPVTQKSCDSHNIMVFVEVYDGMPNHRPHIVCDMGHTLVFNPPGSETAVTILPTDSGGGAIGMGIKVDFTKGNTIDGVRTFKVDFPPAYFLK